MRSLVLLIAGGAILFLQVNRGLTSGSGSYAAGRLIGVLLGVALVVAGVRSLTKGSCASY